MHPFTQAACEPVDPLHERDVMLNEFVFSGFVEVAARTDKRRMLVSTVAHVRVWAACKDMTATSAVRARRKPRGSAFLEGSPR